MERRPPSELARNRTNHSSATMKDAKQSFAKNDARSGPESPHDAHDPESQAAFLERMHDKLKESGKNKTEDS